VLQPYAIEPINPYMAEMKETVKSLAVRGLALLDAEGPGSELASCLEAAGSGAEQADRMSWRSFCYGLDGLNKYCSAVLLEEEALGPLSSRPIVELLQDQGVVAAARVDAGFFPLNSFGEQGTEGEVLLEERCDDLYKSGIRLAKWRTIVQVSAEMPTDITVWENADRLAKSARVCQAHGLAVLAEIQTSHPSGSHSIERTAYICEKFYSHTVRMMNEYDVNLEAVVFSVDLCTAGPEAMLPQSEQVASYTVQTLMRTLPPCTGCVFLRSVDASLEEAARKARAVQDAAPSAPWQIAPV